MAYSVPAIRLLPLADCLLSEIRDPHWEFVKVNCIELPNAKTDGPVVPLRPEALTLLSPIPREKNNHWAISCKLSGLHLTDLQRP